MKKVIKAIIVDDDDAARNILQRFLEVGDSVKIVESVNNAFDAFEAVNKLKPHVIFLDINMPEEDGLTFAKKLRDSGVEVQIVFTTAYKDYAIDAFHIKPIDYLVKPFGLNEVFDVLTKVENHFDKIAELNHNKKVWGSVFPEKLRFKIDAGYIFVKPKDILYFKVRAAYVQLVFCNLKTETIRYTLEELYDEVRAYNFFKLNRSVIINLSHIERIEKSTRKCILKGTEEEVEFPVSQPMFKKFESLSSVKLG